MSDPIVSDPLWRLATRAVTEAQAEAGAEIEEAKTRGKARVEEICRCVDANSLEAATISEIERLVRHGYHSIDLVIRKDGRERRFEADWLARLLR